MNNHRNTYLRVSERTIVATPNHSQRTFTLRVYQDGVLSAKYRTLPVPREEFNNDLYMTSNDWLQFLKTDSYYPVKK